MTNQKMHWPKVLRLTALLAFVAGVIAYGTFVWQENKAMDEMVSPGLMLINYTEKDVYASVYYSKYPNPGQGAYQEAGPKGGGGGISCCVPIPTHWHPGIKMKVIYRFGNWREGKEETKVLELPEYPGGAAGDLHLVFHSETDFELISSRYSPSHAKWPGKRVEKIIHGVQ